MKPQYSQKKWHGIFQKFQESQMTIEAFCQTVPCSPPQFYYWKKKLSFQKITSIPKPPRSTNSDAPKALSNMDTGVDKVRNPKWDEYIEKNSGFAQFSVVEKKSVSRVHMRESKKIKLVYGASKMFLDSSVDALWLANLIKNLVSGV